MRILQVIYGLNIGGAETFIYNILSNLNEEEYHIDFVIQDPDIKNEKLYKLCKDKNSHIYIVPKFNKFLFSYVNEMRKIFSKRYDIVHIHMNSLINVVPVFLAREMNTKVILHSHSTRNNQGGKLGKIVHYLNRNIISRIETLHIACGKDAGKWMFGNREFVILDNAVSISNYQYDEMGRMKLREKLGSQNQKVIGHVGRFVEVKNHRFILNLFAQYVLIHPDTVLVLVGNGPLMEEMELLAETLGIKNKVHFEGSKTNVQEYYSCFDCLLFPSHFEGIPFVLVEAQASGLPIVASNNVSKAVDVTGNIMFLSLEEEQKWLQSLEVAVQKRDRQSGAESMKKSRYNIDVLIEKIEAIYNM